MPVLEATDDRIAPKSILRHRPIGDGTHGDSKGVASQTVPVKPRASRSHPVGAQEDVAEWKRVAPMDKTTLKLPAARRTRSTIVQKVPAASTRTKTTGPTLPTTRPPGPQALLRKPVGLLKAHPLFYLGLGMITMLFLWVMVNAAVDWAHTTLDDIHYGRPRTFQTDAWVGHNEQTGIPSHFIAINLHGHIEIIEIAGGDPAHTRMYSGPQLYGENNDLTPVTLRFVDVNGDHKPDMIISFQDTCIVYINDQNSFRPLLPTERSQVEHFLQYMGP